MLEQLLNVYFPVGEEGPTDRLCTRGLEKFLQMVSKSRNPAATRGYVLAVSLPDHLLTSTSLSLDKSIKVVSNPKAKVDSEGDAETWQNAMTSISRIVDAIPDIDRELKAQLAPHVQHHGGAVFD